MYKATVFYNNGNTSDLSSDDLPGLKDILCTFSFPRTDVDVVKVYKLVNDKKWRIGTIKRGQYNDA